MLLIPIPDHTEQYGNAKRAESLRVAKVMDQNKLNSPKLDSSLQELKKEESGECDENKPERIITRGIQSACDMIENYAVR